MSENQNQPPSYLMKHDDAIRLARENLNKARQEEFDAAVALVEDMQKEHPEHIVRLETLRNGAPRVTIADRAALERVMTALEEKFPF